MPRWWQNSLQWLYADTGTAAPQVNHKEVISPHQQLEQCDRVEVFESAWAEADPLHLGASQVEHSRQVLQRIFTRSGSLSGDLTGLGLQPV